VADERFLGIDAGGTSTRALVLDAAGAVVFRGDAAGANFASHSLDHIRTQLSAALQGCPPVQACVGCFAGILTEAVRQQAMALLRELVQAEAYDARPDFHATVLADPNADIVVIAGTGAIVASRHGQEVRKSGGGGYILGDEGSGQSIGRRALQATLLPARRPAVSEEFNQALRDIWGSDEPAAVIQALYASKTPAAHLAQLAPTVVNDWVSGWDYARDPVEKPVECLAAEVGLHREVHFSPSQKVRIGLAGGVWQMHPKVREHFAQHPALAHQEVFRIEAEPVRGAVRWAEALAEANQ